jgi:hypothetical protein
MEGNATVPTIANPALDVSAFDGRPRIARLHQELTDFLHYQSHVRLYAATSLPPSVPEPDNQAWKNILQLIREEQRRIGILRWLLNTTKANNKDLIATYDDASPSEWGNGAGWN